MTTAEIDERDLALRRIARDALNAKSAHERADGWDQELYSRMREAHALGVSLAVIAEAAGCSKTWAKRCVDAEPGRRP